MHVAGDLYSSSILPATTLLERAAPSSKCVRVERVPVSTVDAVFALYAGGFARPFLKIDAQGYEWDVLNGAESTLDRFVGIQAEMSLVELYEGQRLFLDYLTRLRDQGFRLAALFPGFVDNSSGHLLQVDAVFFR
jgi:hypothetical protein